MIWQSALLFGALVGGGIALAVRAFSPAHPDLAAALAQLQVGPAAVAAPGSRDSELAPRDARERLGAALERSLLRWSSLRVPERDLEVLAATRRQWLGQKAFFALIGLVFPPVLFAVVNLLYPVPFVLPVLASLAFAAVLWFMPDIDVRQRADEARHEFGYAAMAYADLVALERMAGSGTVQALERAAAIGDNWVFHRISEQLELARLSGQPPWAALEDLATRLDLPNLQEVASIVRLSGENDSSIYDNLRSRSSAMRHAQQADARANANAASERMVAPLAALGLTFICLTGYPAVQAILS